MNMQNILRTSLMTMALVGLSACGSQDESASLDPEAYEYKGAADQLLATSGADRAESLASRFDQIQGRQ